MKAIDDIIADISEFDQECARHEYTDVDEVWSLLHGIKGRLERAQNEWIIHFWLDGVYMSAKVQAINEKDAHSVVAGMFPDRVVGIASTHMTYCEKVDERA